MNRNFTLSAAAVTLALASVFNAPEASAQSGQKFQTQLQVPQQQLRQVATGSYYSPQLKARFVLQYMSIPGHSFWGARITNMDYNSPLHRINLQLGDVVTRLDGIRISNNRFQKTDPATGSLVWQLPQMEKHYSQTAVRYIRSGQSQVHETTVDIGPLRCNIHNPQPHHGNGIVP